MVTTRSADKRIAAEVKIEDLALRSRQIPVDHLASPTPASLETKAKAKITIVIPPPPSLEGYNLIEGGEDSPYLTAKESPGTPHDDHEHDNKQARDLPAALNESQAPLEHSSTKVEDHPSHPTTPPTQHRGTKRKPLSRTPTPQHNDDTGSNSSGTIVGTFVDTAQPASTEAKAPKLEIESTSDEDGTDDAPEVVSSKVPNRNPFARPNPFDKPNKRKKTKRSSSPLGSITIIDVAAPGNSPPSVNTVTVDDATDSNPHEVVVIASDTPDVAISMTKFSSSPPPTTTASPTLPIPFKPSDTNTPQIPNNTTHIVPIPTSIIHPAPPPSLHPSSSQTSNASTTSTLRTTFQSLNLQSTSQPQQFHFQSSGPINFQKRNQTLFPSSTSLPPKSRNSLETFRRQKINARLMRSGRLHNDWNGKRVRFLEVERA